MSGSFLPLTSILPQALNHRLSNLSTLHRLIDCYCVCTDKRSGIVNVPNRLDDPQYIIRLIGKVMALSLETVKIVGGLHATSLSEQEIIL